MGDRVEILRNINNYEADQLFEFYVSGILSLSDIRSAGYHFAKRQVLEKLIDDFEQRIARENEERIAEEAREQSIWDAVCEKNQIDDYQAYLSIYPNGRFSGEAQLRIARINIDLDRQKRKLFEDMKCNPRRYPHEYVNAILDPERFIRDMQNRNANWREYEPDLYDNVMNVWRHLKVSIQDLVINEVIPNNPRIHRAMRLPDTNLEQRHIREFENAPAKRTDVYMIGIPRSGKSCVIGAIVKKGHQDASMLYDPHFVTKEGRNVDYYKPYYDQLIAAMDMGCPPDSTVEETLAMMKLDVRYKDKYREKIIPINLFEIGGEIFKGVANVHHLIEGNRISQIWYEEFVPKVVGTNNRKMIFFIVDYRFVIDDIGTEQQTLLENILLNLSQDGPNRNNPTVNCTMSKADSVVVLVTKCDLMETDDRNVRQQIAEEYLKKNYLTFLVNIKKLSEKYGFNGGKGVKVKTFSTGKYYIGNSFNFDSTDAEEMIAYFSENASYR